MNFGFNTQYIIITNQKTVTFSWQEEAPCLFYEALL